jgi:hypothetical protein
MASSRGGHNADPEPASLDPTEAGIKLPVRCSFGAPA